MRSLRAALRPLGLPLDNAKQVSKGPKKACSTSFCCWGDINSLPHTELLGDCCWVGDCRGLSLSSRSMYECSVWVPLSDCGRSMQVGLSALAKWATVTLSQDRPPETITRPDISKRLMAPKLFQQFHHQPAYPYRVDSQTLQRASSEDKYLYRAPLPQFALKSSQ